MFRFSEKRFFAPETEEGIEPEEGDEPVEGEEGTEPEEGDEPVEGEEGTEPEEGDEPPQARKESRVQRLANEARIEREKRIAAEARAEALERSRTPTPDNSAEAARIRAEKLSLMDPTERKVFEQDETIKRLEQGQQFTQLQIADYSDRAAYEARAATNPVYAKHKDWVESALVAARKAGNNPSREALIRWKIGDDAVNAKPTKKLAAKKAEAAERVATSKGAATGARSDVKGKADNDDSLDSLRARILAREASGNY